jgi:ubiquinone/menaquinone biosynthesis C-methylase UbiE
LGYGGSVEQYLALGDEHTRAMREMLNRTGSSLESAGRIMDFGCATGRMIRWLHDVSHSCEIWATDICSDYIMWCKQYLSPPFHFATTTTSPHLPFEDRYFGLIYAGSVFTHIDDLAETWFMELRRVLRPGGKLFITVHRGTIAKFQKSPDWWLTRFLRSCPEYEGYCRSGFGMFTVGRSISAQVFFDVDYLCRRLEPFFQRLAVGVGAHGHQSGVLLERV